jgi:hypothetical protein
VGGIIMRYIFSLVFIVLFFSSFLFADDSRLNCSETRVGNKILNCKKDEDCSNKKIIYDVDIFCALKDIYKISTDSVYTDIEQIPEGIKTSYILWQYLGDNSDKIYYMEYLNGEFYDRVSFFCASSLRDDEDWDVCLRAVYRINNEEIGFDRLLRNHDRVYDWVIDNMPRFREKSRFINVGEEFVIFD